MLYYLRDNLSDIAFQKNVLNIYLINKIVYNPLKYELSQTNYNHVKFNVFTLQYIKIFKYIGLQIK